MNRKIVSLVICLALVFGRIELFAKSDTCAEKEVVIAFFNGVQNTEDEAQKSLRLLKSFYGDTAPNGTKIQYELLYNATYSVFDFFELYEQKIGAYEREIKEVLEKHMELFWDMVGNRSTWYEEIFGAIEFLILFSSIFKYDLLILNYGKACFFG